MISEINRAASEDNVDTVVLGCASMGHFPSHVSNFRNTRLIDGVTSTAELAKILAK